MLVRKYVCECVSVWVDGKDHTVKLMLTEAQVCVYVRVLCVRVRVSCV